METSASEKKKREDYYECLHEAQEFEQFWCEVIEHKLHLKLTRIRAKQNQSRFLCDTKEGFEFKHNRGIEKYKGVFIEVRQKMDKDDPDFMPSSIGKKDNAWMYCIGDFNNLYFVPKKILIGEYESQKYEIKPNKDGTALGFRLPLDRLEEISVLKLNPINKEVDHSTTTITPPETIDHIFGSYYEQ